MRFLLALLFLSLLPDVTAGWKELPWPVLNATLPVWIPEHSEATGKHPAIIYYHGAGGQPDAETMRQMTEGKDFVIVGMTYKEQGTFNHGIQEIADELGFLNALKKRLVESLSVDPKRIYVAGFSKGGWHASLLLDHDRTLAGGLILGGGVFEMRKDSLKFLKPMPIYIGCGRYDGNYPSALGAMVYFRNLGGEITFDTWPDLEHQIPNTPPEALRQWLRIQADAPDLKKEATDWIASRFMEIETISDPVDQWFAYDEFSSLPFVKNFGAETSAVSEEKIALLLENPKVSVEKKWRGESRKILARESRDRLLVTLQQASQSHYELSLKAVGTRAGVECARDFKRSQELLKSAKIVTRPGPQAEPITPKAPPSSPTANPDRGPFFPPGITVKPAE